MPAPRRESQLKKEAFAENSQAVQAHLSIAQSVIQRTANNSAACKTWCVTLVSAILVIVAGEGKGNLAPLAIIPILLFFFLDTYYLALEQRFRNAYNSFIDRLHERKLESADLYAVVPQGKPMQTFFAKILSPSIWPFYLVLVVLTLLAMFFVIGTPATAPKL